MASKFQQIIDDLKNVGSYDQKHKDGTSKRRATYSGALVGLIGGMMIGFAKKWNILASAGGGAIIGGLVGNMITPRD